MPAAVGDVVHSRINFELDARPWSVGLYHQILTLDAEINPNEATAVLIAASLASLQPALTEGTQFCSVYCTTDDGAKQAPGLATLVDTTGTYVSEALPVNNAAVLRFRQVSDPARNDGRCYISGIPEAATTLNGITDQAVLDALLSWGAAIETIDQVGPEFQARHVIKGFQPDPAPPGLIEYRDVTGYIANATIFTQARRTTRHFATKDLGP